MPSTDNDRLREEWLREEAAAFEGWDFSHLRGRMVEGELPWSYDDILREYLRPECRLLDMGTGGGEYLLSLGHPPMNTAVTEGYAPNIE